MSEDRLLKLKRQEHSFPLLITKLSIIRENYNNSIEKRKQKIKDREKEIEFHEKRLLSSNCINSYHNKGITKSLSTNYISNEQNNSRNKEDLISINDFNKTIAKNNSNPYSKTSKNFSNKPFSKLEMRMSKTTSKFNYSKSPSGININSNEKINGNMSPSIGLHRQCSLQPPSSKTLLAGDQTKTSLFNSSLKHVKKYEQIIPASKRYINKNVYGISDDILHKLKKIQINKGDVNLKEYHESLIALGKDILTKDSLKKLGKKFNRMRKDTDIKLGNTRRFLKRMEYKEEQIIDNINKIGSQASFLFGLFQEKNTPKYLKKIKFEPVMK